MKVAKKKQHLISVVALGLLLLLATPGTAFGDKRRRGHNREWNNRDWNSRQWNNRQWNNRFRKWRFVNRHDARDGRWDGRGPRRVRFINRFRDRDDWARRNRTLRNFDDKRWNRSRWIVRRSYWR